MKHGPQIWTALIRCFVVWTSALLRCCCLPWKAWLMPWHPPMITGAPPLVRPADVLDHIVLPNLIQHADAAAAAAHPSQPQSTDQPAAGSLPLGFALQLGDSMLAAVAAQPRLSTGQPSPSVPTVPAAAESAAAAAALAAWRPADLLHALFWLLDRRPAVEQSGNTAVAIRMAGQLVALLAAAPGSAAATAAAGAAKQYAWRTRLLLAPLLAAVVAHGGDGGGGGSGGNRVAAPGLTPPALRALPVHAAEQLAAAGVALADLVAAAAPDSSAPVIPNCPCLLKSCQSACWRHHWLPGTGAARRLDCMWVTVELIVLLASHTLPASRHVNAN